jgi:hypothetical protein
MERAEYMEVQARAIALGHEIARMPLEEVLAALVKMEAVELVFDPDQYRAGIEPMLKYKELIASLLAVKTLTLKNERDAAKLSSEVWTRAHNFVPPENFS